MYINVNFKAAQHRSQFLQLSIKCDKSLLLTLFLKILTLGFSLSVLPKDTLAMQAVTKMADLTKSRQTDFGQSDDLCPYPPSQKNTPQCCLA